MNFGTFRTFALATGFAVASAFGALAATVTVSAPVFDTTAPLALSPGASFSSAPYVGVGSAGSLYKSPFDDTTTKYYFVEGRENTASLPVNSPAIMLLKSVRNAFSMLWGSPDSYNNLEFFLGGVSKLVVNGGTDVNGGSPLNNGPTKNVSVTGLKFDEVRFYSNGKNAFEFANVAAVPVPAAGLLLLTAIGGMAAARRRKQA